MIKEYDKICALSLVLTFSVTFIVLVISIIYQAIIEQKNKIKDCILRDKIFEQIKNKLPSEDVTMCSQCEMSERLETFNSWSCVFEFEGKHNIRTDEVRPYCCYRLFKQKKGN